MPSVSKQKAAGLALSAKRGERSPQTLKGAAREMYEPMTARQIKEFAETKRKALPSKR